MTARKRLAMVSVAAAAAVGAAPAQASVDSLVAAGPGGTAQFAWGQGVPGQAHTRALSSGGVLGDTQVVSPANKGAYAAAIGTDSDGDAVVAWMEGNFTWVLRARTVRADGGLSPAQTLSPTGATAPKVAVEADGDAVFTWTKQTSPTVVQARRRAADGTLGPILTLSYAAANAQDPDVAVAADGTATVAWLRRTAANNFYVQTRTIAPGGALGEVKNLTPTTESATAPQVHVSGAGTALIAWVRGANGPVVYRVRTAAGTLGNPVTVTGSMPPGVPAAASGMSLRTGSNAAGRTAFTWTEFNGLFSTTKGRIRAANGTLGPIFDVSATGQSPAAVALDPDGNATFAWTGPHEAGMGVQSRRRSAAGSFGPARFLSAPATFAELPHVVVDGGGKATVAWRESVDGMRARTVTPGGTLSVLLDLNAGG